MIYEKMPPKLAEIPYGFKNLWRISVTGYNVVTNAFNIADITGVILNGEPVTVDQMTALYDYNRDPASLTSSTQGGIYVTLTGRSDDATKFNFALLVSQTVDVEGVVSVTGDVVDNTDPLRPVVQHDTTKLDVSQYSDDTAALESRLDTDESNIATNTTAIQTISDEYIGGITVNGVVQTVQNNVAAIVIDTTTAAQLAAGLDTKVDKSIGSVTQSTSDTFNTTTRTLTLNKTAIDLDSGATTPTATDYALADLLGVTALEAIDKELFYFCDDPADTMSIGDLYRLNADGSKYIPATADNITVVYGLSVDYSTFGMVNKIYISSIGWVTGSSGSSVSLMWANLAQYQLYNRYNAYKSGTIVMGDAPSAYLVLQDVPVPTGESNVISLENHLYYSPVMDDTDMPAGTMWANFEDMETGGASYTTDVVRKTLMGNGYDNYINFKGAIPATISSDTEFTNNINAWVADGLGFTSYTALVAYLSTSTRYTLTNKGIVIIAFDGATLTLTPAFTESTIAVDIGGNFQPVPTAFVSGRIPIYNTSGILVDSGNGINDFATAAQGEKADSSVQSLVLAAGTVPGTLALTVDGNVQTAFVGGIGSAAYSSASSFATAAQGAKADSSIQSVNISTGPTQGTIQYNTGGAVTTVPVAGLQSAAYSDSGAFATAAQGVKADSALQAANVVDNLSSSVGTVPLSANQGRVLHDLILSIDGGGKPIGGFATYAARYTTTDQYATDLQPININDTIYIASDENHTNQPAQYRVSAIDGSNNITYSFVRIIPDVLRDFTSDPIQPWELAQQTVVSTEGAGDFVTGATQSGGNIILNKNGTAFKTVAFDGTGNVITSAVPNGNTLTLIRGNALTSIGTSGAGNVLADVAADGTLTKTTALTSVTKQGSGNVITDISANGGAVTATSGTMLQSLSITGSGNVITGITATGGTITATRGNVVAGINDASTSQKGIVQLNDTLTSTSIAQALTANAGKQLNDKITANDALYLKLDTTQTVTGIKTFLNDIVSPVKNTLPANPLNTAYATEAQVATRIPRPANATANNLAAFDANRNLVDSGVSATSLEVIPITSNEINLAVDAVWG